MQATQSPVASTTMVLTSFGFALQDEISHGDLPQPTSHLLELIPQVAHIEVHSDVV